MLFSFSVGKHKAFYWVFSRFWCAVGEVKMLRWNEKQETFTSKWKLLLDVEMHFEIFSNNFNASFIMSRWAHKTINITKVFLKILELTLENLILL